MDYKEKYENGVECIQEILGGAGDSIKTSILRKRLQAFFPELKEDEGETTRKSLISFLKSPFINENIVDEKVAPWITWLEKQKEPKDAGEISDGYHTFNELYRYRMLYNAAFFNLLPKELVHKSKRHHDGEECFGGGWFIVMANLPTGQISNHYELKDWDLFQIPERDVADEWDGHTPQEAADRLHKYLLEEQGEKKKLGGNRPWFKVGDWIVINEATYQITKIDNSHVVLSLNGIECNFRLDVLDNAHFWTIEDAKDGDVLANKHNILILKELDYDWSSNGTPNAVKAYCGIKPNGNFEIGKDNWCFCGTLYIHPATKEQRDTLFAKMKEAGYEWDVDKKELKKIEQKSVDKAEPKFKVGNWYQCTKDFFGKGVTFDKNTAYYCAKEGCLQNEYGCHIAIDKNLHDNFKLWTIEDAKDGDVLASEDKDKIFLYNGKLDLRGRACAYCGIYKTYDGLRFAKCTVGNYFTYKEPYPTTKEQRDTLFAKMADAGYEWDSEKKELRKIEQKKADADKVINWVNPNKVIEWLKNTIKETEEYLGEYGEYYDIHLTLPYDSIEDLIDDFKKNFKL
jgi:hypothetical protein